MRTRARRPLVAKAAAAACIAAGALGILGAPESAHAQCCVPGFVPAVAYPEGINTNPDSVVVADFDLDGRLDMAVANYSTNTVYLKRGNPNGNGTFTTVTSYAVGNGPATIAVGDFNNDGKPDLAVANYNNGGAGSVSILLGTGNPFNAFTSAVNYPAGQGSISVAVGDFNADGWPDLAVSNASANTVSILRNNGCGNNGTFSASPYGPYTVGASPRHLAVRDLSGDGRPDIVVANYGSNTISVLLANAIPVGDFWTTPVATYPVGAQPHSVAIGDFNCDGRPDLAVANINNNNVSILLNDNTNFATWGTFLPAVNYPVGAGPHFITTADLNNDGRLDLAVANYFSSPPTISILRGNGNGTFLTHVTYPVGTGPLSIAVGDFNCDGRPDLAVANRSGDNASVILSTCTSCFGPAIPNILAQPVGVNVSSGSAAEFGVTASPGEGGGELAYQWRSNGEPLADGHTSTGTVVSGATTPTLTLSSVALADNGVALDCIITDSDGGSVRSDPAGLGVTPSCTADFNRDGVVNSQDFFDFLAAFFTGCP